MVTIMTALMVENGSKEEVYKRLMELIETDSLYYEIEEEEKTNE